MSKRRTRKKIESKRSRRSKRSKSSKSSAGIPRGLSFVAPEAPCPFVAKDPGPPGPLPVHECSLAKWPRETRDALSQPPVQVWDTELAQPLRTYPAVPTALARAGDAGCGEVWLWCMHCQRFFQAKHLEIDFLGNWQRCPFDDCQTAGFDIDILHWENGLHEPGWPTEAELYPGLRYAWPPGAEERSTWTSREIGMAR